MKRHESLAPLSRQHHPALMLAQLLKIDAPAYKGMPATAAAKADYAGQLFHSDLKTHFSKEEAMLEKVIKYHPDIKKLAAQIVQEHRELSAAFLAIPVSDDVENALDALGRKLELHIRKEERVLFPLVEQYSPPEILEDIKILLQ